MVHFSTHHHTMTRPPNEHAMLESVLSQIGQHADSREGYIKALEDTIRELRAQDQKRDGLSSDPRILQDQIIHTSKLATLGELVGGIAHEINNPLQILLGHVQLLQLGKDVERRTEIIKEQIDRIVQITKRLVDLSRSVPENDVMEPVSLSTAIEQIIPLLAYQLRSNDIDLELKFDPTVPAVNGNMVALQQVFLNIFLNARDAIGKNGKITAETFADNEKIYVRITDTGCGIPEENLEHIFEPFFTTKGIGRGAGFGLGVSSEIMKKHNGEITVQSEVGIGSTVSVVFPIRKIQKFTSASI
jgi:two-component system, NtrC family, sensor kinase